MPSSSISPILFSITIPIPTCIRICPGCLGRRFMRLVVPPQGPAARAFAPGIVLFLLPLIKWQVGALFSFACLFFMAIILLIQENRP